MAREKRTAHKSPNSLADANRDITSAQVELIRNQNTLEHRQALANSSVPEEIPVPIGFAAQTVDEAQKPKRQRDLEKARNILERRQNGQSVTWAELDWAKTLCARETKLEEAESEKAKATEIKRQQWQQDQARRIQEINAANRDPTWTTRKLLRVRLGEGDKSDSESDSDLSSPGGVSDVAALEPARRPGDDNGSDEEDEKDTEAPQTQVSSAIFEENTHINNKQPQAPLSSPLDDANNDMAAEENVSEDSDLDIWDDDVWARMTKVEE